MCSQKWISGSSITAGLCFLTSFLNSSAATDPGVRSGTDAGPPLPGLTPAELNAFTLAKEVFTAVDSVRGDIAGEDDVGLGPTFNLNSCSGCHAFPTTGGTSPKVNPQIALATLHGARNTVPSFLTANGPIREVRFKRKADGSPDGGVSSLFVITGRSDAPPGFNLPQTDFATQVTANNVSFRIPTPVFGLGLIEAIPDSAILANQGTNPANKKTLGIAGKANRSGNDGTITRFGWKAQNKSLMIFAGEAYQVEQGVTNELFPNPRELGNQTLPAGQPESMIDLATGGIADVEHFTTFMRLLNAPQPRNPTGVPIASVVAGGKSFVDLGCIECHSPVMTTGTSPVAALSNKPVLLLSDLLVHKMGPGLADDVTQGAANIDEFRTAPLWGLGQRIFLLHDGRTKDLNTAILAHASPGNNRCGPSEANVCIQNYNNLADPSKQDLFNFLRSL